MIKTEILKLIKDGFKIHIFKGRKNIYEISFTKRIKKPFSINGVSYMQEDFTQKQLHKILNILKQNKTSFSIN